MLRGVGCTRSSLARSVRLFGSGGGGAPEPPPEEHGLLFGEKRLAPGEKRKKEDWEQIYVWGMGIAFVLMVVGFWTRPHSKPSAWARDEMLSRQKQNKD